MILSLFLLHYSLKLNFLSRKLKMNLTFRVQKLLQHNNIAKYKNECLGFFRIIFFLGPDFELDLGWKIDFDSIILFLLTF